MFGMSVTYIRINLFILNRKNVKRYHRPLEMFHITICKERKSKKKKKKRRENAFYLFKYF